MLPVRPDPWPCVVPGVYSKLLYLSFALRSVFPHKPLTTTSGRTMLPGMRKIARVSSVNVVSAGVDNLCLHLLLKARRPVR